MTRRGLAVQGSLAVAGLAFAYATWQREPETAVGDVTVLDAGKNDLVKVRFEGDAGRWIELLRRSGEGEPAVWLRVAAEGAKKAPERELRASEAGARLFEKFAPLRASRALGILPGDKLKELDLDPAKKKIVVATKGESRTFQAGIPGAGQDGYLRDDRDGRVYLVGRSLLTDLEQAATRFVDRAVHAWKTTDAERITVAAGGKKRELVVLDRTSPHGARLAPARTPDKADETLKNWHDRVAALFPSDVLGRGESPAGGPPAVLLRLDYAAGSKGLGFVELARGPEPPPTTSEPTPPPAPAGSPAPSPAASAPTGPDWFLRSEHTAGWLKIPATAADLVKEGEKIAATE